MAEIVVSCAGDSALARDVYDYTCSNVRGLDNGQASANIEYISLDEDEITIDHKSLIPKKTVRQILDSFIKLNSERLKSYQIVESGDIFIVGIVIEPSKMDGLLTCEFCGYFTPYAEDLFAHRRMHAAGG